MCRLLATQETRGGTAVDTNRTPQETQVLYALLGRRDNYDLNRLMHSTGKYYDVWLRNGHYTAVVLYSSFEYYLKRYHLARVQPTLCICMIHNTVLPIDCLSLQASNYAVAYELPETIVNVEKQRYSKTGSRVLLGMYILGMHNAVDLIESLPPTTRKRYLSKAKALQKRTRGKPVGNKFMPQY